jgi:hypothetical protein
MFLPKKGPKALIFEGSAAAWCGQRFQPIDISLYRAPGRPMVLPCLPSAPHRPIIKIGFAVAPGAAKVRSNEEELRECCHRKTMN